MLTEQENTEAGPLTGSQAEAARWAGAETLSPGLGHGQKACVKASDQEDVGRKVMEEAETKPPGWASSLVSAVWAVDPPLQPLMASRWGGGVGGGWMWSNVEPQHQVPRGLCFTQGSATLPCRRGNPPCLLSPGASFPG